MSEIAPEAPDIDSAVAAREQMQAIRSHPRLSTEDRKRLDVRVVQGVREVARIDHWEVEPRRETTR